MEFKKKKVLIAIMGMALASTATSYSYADGKANLIIKDASDSAHANFFIDRVDMPVNVMTEFGYFRTKVKGDIGPMPMPVDDGVFMPEPGMPFIPGDSEHAYLILNIMPLMPHPPIPHPPMPEPIPPTDPEPMPPTDPTPSGTATNDSGVIDPGMPGMGDDMAVDPGMPLPPSGEEPPMPPMPPMHEVLYFELTADQMTIKDESTTVEVDTCQQPQPSMFFAECGVLSVSWQNNGMHSGEDSIKSVSQSMNGMLGQSMKTKRKSKFKYSSASVTADFMMHSLSSDHGGRSSSKSTTKIFIGNSDD